MVAALTTLIVVAATVVLFLSFDREAGGFQYEQRFTWIDLSDFRVQYLFAVDGISLVMVLLTGLLTFLSVLISWHIELRPKEYFAWLLVLETGVLGVFTSLDLVLFFLFWEVELIPMYLLISIWGSGRKEYSAMKFLVYTLAGSGLMLVGLLALGFSMGTFDYMELQGMAIAGTILPVSAIFFLIFAAFAVKLPIFPLHTWLPDAHTDAPTAVSVMLAGVLLKMGGYGIIRFCLGLMPDVAKDYSTLLATLAAVSVVYGAIVTLRQTDLKRLIAYSSVSHMGFVLLGVAGLGVTSVSGAALQMFTHGTITGLLFIVVGLIYERTHTRQIPEMRGLGSRLPFIGLGFVIAGLASLGLPALSGFAAGADRVPWLLPGARSGDAVRRHRRGAGRRLHPVDGRARDARPAGRALGEPERRDCLVGAAARGCAGDQHCRRGGVPGPAHGRYPARRGADHSPAVAGEEPTWPTTCTCLPRSSSSW